MAHEGESQKTTLSYEEFVGKITQQDTSFIDKANAKLGQIPTVLRVLSNLDPTGISGAIICVNDEFMDRLQKERYQKTFYELYLGLTMLNQRVENWESISTTEVAKQIEIFIDKSLNETQTDKIYYFKNILCNGIINSKDSNDEAQIVWNTVAALTALEIKVIVFYVQHKERQVDEYNSVSERAINVNEDADSLIVNRDILQSICYCLHGKGLLRACVGTYIAGDMIQFYPTKYAEKVFAYVQNLEPKDDTK